MSGKRLVGADLVAEPVALGVEVPEVLGQLRRILLGVAGNDAAADDELGHLDAFFAENLVEQLRVSSLSGEGNRRPPSGGSPESRPSRR